MLFSFLATYRNRDAERVRRCLQSLAAQNFDSFEILLIDYGSDPQYRTEVQKISASLGAHYTYLEAQGWLWCKPHALNTALDLAKGEYLIMVDIDMIYPTDFLTVLQTQIAQNRLLHYHCYYLSETFTDYTNLFINKDLEQKFRLSDQNATGLFVVSKMDFAEIGGSDEFYMLWGLEDSDASLRLQAKGLEIKWISPETTHVFHQWHDHPNHNRLVPADWQKAIKTYFENNKNRIFREKIFPKNCFEKRMALEIFEKKDFESCEKIHLKLPLQLGYTELSWRLTKEKGKKFYLHLEESDFEKNTTFTQKMVRKINYFVANQTEYRLTHPLLEADMKKIREWIFFMILFHRTSWQDYYFRFDSECLDWVVLT